MVAVDTNIVVRFLTRDHESQYRKAYRIFNSNEVFVPDTVILETEWVLSHAYGFPAERICDAFERLFGLENVHLTSPQSIEDAIGWHACGLDFSDALHLAMSRECEALYSFDAKFVRGATGLSKCTVKRP